MKKYNQFEIFRFIGAISVIIFHTARNTVFYNKIPILFQNGSIWVYFFFDYFLFCIFNAVHSI